MLVFCESRWFWGLLLLLNIVYLYIYILYYIVGIILVASFKYCIHIYIHTYIHKHVHIHIHIVWISLCISIKFFCLLFFFELFSDVKCTLRRIRLFFLPSQQFDPHPACQGCLGRSMQPCDMHEAPNACAIVAMETGIRVGRHARCWKKRAKKLGDLGFRMDSEQFHQVHTQIQDRCAYMFICFLHVDIVRK